jgi:hypothetical protein
MKRERPPYSYGSHDAVKRERQKAKSQNYMASCDFTHLILAAEIMRSEDKNSRAAQMLESAAGAVRNANVRAWLSSANTRADKNRPVKR